MSRDIRQGWKVLTHDWRPPLQGGEPVCDGVTWPVSLPSVALDTSEKECAAGWNYMATLAQAFTIAGLWPTGRPSRAVLAEAAPDAIERGDKRRTSSLTLIREATDLEIAEAVGEWFPAEYRADMRREQMAWRAALARPDHDEAAVCTGLQRALEARGLRWDLRVYVSAQAARAVWAAWDAWAAWAAQAARDARAVWEAWDAWAARDAWDAWAARDALSIYYARRRGWMRGDAMQYTLGIRDAYRAGLAIALPTGPDTLGWAMG